MRAVPLPLPLNSIGNTKSKAEPEFFVDGKEVGKYNAPKDHA
tara:strand:+ start:369 stop:494 length:126 start_codon:yes stop_codon:yes gene_type:complete